MPAIMHKKLAVIIVTIGLVAENAIASCMPSKGTVVLSGRSSTAVWDIQLPGHSYRVSTHGNFIAVRENGHWKRTEYPNVINYKLSAANVSTCTLTRVMWLYQSKPELWQ